MSRSRYLQHVTLDTGHVRRSPRSEVEAETIPVVSRLLSLALAGEEAWIPGVEPRCRLAADASGRCLVAMVWGPDVGVYHVPLVTLGVAGRSTCGTRLWRRLHEGRPAAIQAARPGGASIVALAPVLLRGLSARCHARQKLAWCWLEMRRRDQ